MTSPGYFYICAAVFVTGGILALALAFAPLGLLIGGVILLMLGYTVFTKAKPGPPPSARDERRETPNDEDHGDTNTSKP